MIVFDFKAIAAARKKLTGEVPSGGYYIINPATKKPQLVASIREWKPEPQIGTGSSG